MKTTQLRECCADAASGASLKPGANVLKDVKVLGLESLNGRRYLPEAVAKALPLYEKQAVYFDHAGEGKGEARPFLAKFGSLRNPRIDETGGIRADLHFNGKHVHAETFRGWVESDPSAIGLSHSATGRVREAEDGTLVVEEIVSVESVDIVSSPATTRGLFESTSPPETKMDPELTMPVDPAPGEEGYEAFLGKLISAIVADSELSMDEKRKKVLAALKLLDEPETKTEPEPEAKPEPEEAQAEESIRVLADKMATMLTEALQAKLNTLTIPTPVPESRTSPRQPVALPPSPASKPTLTVDTLLSAIKGN